MSTNLATQIRDYAHIVDTEQPPLTLDELRDVRVGVDPVRPVAPGPEKPIRREDALAAAPSSVRPFRSRTTSRRTQAWVSAVASAAVLLLVGGAAWLLRADPPEEPAISTTVVPTTVTPTTVPPPTIAPIEELGLSNVVPGLGTLRWQRYDGDRDTLPPGIDNGAAGGFVFPQRGWLGDDPRTWESDDGLAWTPSTLSGVPAGHRGLDVDGNWAQAYPVGGESSAIYFRDGNAWELIDLPLAPVPATAGINWGQGTTSTPVEHDGVTFIAGSVWGNMDLATVYGPDSGSAWDSIWDPIAEQLAVTGDGQRVRGHLDMAVVADRIEFTDALLGPDVVFTVDGAADFTAEVIADRLMRNEDLRINFGLVSGPDRVFGVVDVPWDNGSAHVFAAPSGGFAVYNFEPQDWWTGDDSFRPAVWTSPDGVTWTDHGVPEFVDPASSGAAWISSSGDDRLWATSAPLDSGAIELWTSVDGVSWQLVDAPVVEELFVYEADFGFVAANRVGDYLGIRTAPTYLVSTDGLTFHPVIGPPMDELDMWLFESSIGAAGDFLYAIGRPCITEPTNTCSNSATDARVLWIGRFNKSS